MNLAEFQNLTLAQVRSNIYNMNEFLNYVLALEIEGRDDLILTHNSAAQLYRTVKELEDKLRVRTAKVCFPNPKAKVTETLKLGAGWSVKGKFGNTYKVEEETIKATLGEVSKRFGVAGEAAIDGLIAYKPSLSEKVYDVLSDEIKAVVDESLTIKPAKPTIELIAPKEQ